MVKTHQNGWSLTTTRVRPLFGTHSLMPSPLSSVHEDHSVSNSGFSHQSALPSKHCFQLEVFLSPPLRCSCLPTDFQYKQSLQSLAEHVHPFPSSLPPSSNTPITQNATGVWRRKRERTRQTWGSKPAVEWLASKTAFVALTSQPVSTFPWFF